MFRANRLLSFIAFFVDCCIGFCSRRDNKEETKSILIFLSFHLRNDVLTDGFFCFFFSFCVSPLSVFFSECGSKSIWLSDNAMERIWICSAQTSSDPKWKNYGKKLSITETYQMIQSHHVLVFDHSNQFWKLSFHLISFWSQRHWPNGLLVREAARRFSLVGWSRV